MLVVYRSSTNFRLGTPGDCCITLSPTFDLLLRNDSRGSVSGHNFSRATKAPLTRRALTPAQVTGSNVVRQPQEIPGPSKSALNSGLPTMTAYANTAGKSSASSSGYSSRIVSCLPQVASHPRTSHTVMRRPRIHGCLHRLSGSMVVRDSDAVATGRKILPDDFFLQSKSRRCLTHPHESYILIL